MGVPTHGMGCTCKAYWLTKCKNTGTADITTGWDLYYTLTDAVTKDVQSFYLPLDGFSVKAGQTVHLHVDTTGEPGHFRADPNSMFYTGENATKVEVTLHATGYAPQTASVQKDAAGAEAGGDSRQGAAIHRGGAAPKRPGSGGGTRPGTAPRIRCPIWCPNTW